MTTPAASIEIKGDVHTCPVSGCGTRIFAGLLMCRRHWHMVPRRLKDEVSRTWRSFSNGSTVEERRAARPAYELARKAAIDSVEGTAS